MGNKGNEGVREVWETIGPMVMGSVGTEGVIYEDIPSLPER